MCEGGHDLHLVGIGCLSNVGPVRVVFLAGQGYASDEKEGIVGVANQSLLLDVPFNETKEECGVRLSPLASNLLEWHFSFTGVEDSAYHGGVYHGRIRLHPEYPRKAPSISMITPTGRWEVGKEICLSASAYHQETWDVNWNLRTLVMSLRGFILSQPLEIGGISTTRDRQRALAAASRDWVCPVCKIRHDDLLRPMSPVSQGGGTPVAPLPSCRLITSDRVKMVLTINSEANDNDHVPEGTGKAKAKNRGKKSGVVARKRGRGDKALFSGLVPALLRTLKTIWLIIAAYFAASKLLF